MALEYRRLGFDPHLVDYADAFALQKQLHVDAMADPSRSTVLLLEHADVYTAGKRTEDHEKPRDGTPVVEVDRGERSPGTDEGSSSATLFSTSSTGLS